MDFIGWAKMSIKGWDAPPRDVFIKRWTVQGVWVTHESFHCYDRENKVRAAFYPFDSLVYIEKFDNEDQE